MILVVIIGWWVAQSLPFGVLLGAGVAWANRNDRPSHGTSEGERP